MSNEDLPTRKDKGKDLQKMSFIEKLSGRHTNTFAVFLIFIITIATFIIYLIFEETKDNTVVSGLMGILTTTLGYFIGKGSSQE